MGKRPVLPRPAAFEKTAIEASLYRRAYLIRRGQVEQKRIPLPELGFWPYKKCFDLKWLHTRIHSITDADYDRVKLKRMLGDKLKTTIAACHEQKREFSEADWQNIVVGEDVRGLFPLEGRGKNKTLAEASACEVKVFAVDVLPVKRYPLDELAYAKGKTDVWNPDYFEDSTSNILRRDESQQRRPFRGRKLILIPVQKPQGRAVRWKGFLDDSETQEKLKNLRGEVEHIANLLPGPKPKKMTEAEKTAWVEKEKALEKAINEFQQKHDLPKYPFLFTSESDRPAKRFTPWKRILFEPKDRIFSADALKDQAKSMVGLNASGSLECFADCLPRFADSLEKISDKQQQETLWKEFCKVVCVVAKKSLQDFISRNQKPTAQQWIEFFKCESGPNVKLVEQISGTGFDEYRDLSKDHSGQFAKAGGMGGKPSNKGYLICENKTEKRIQAFPVRFFESEKTVQERLIQTGWEPLDKQMWRKGELLHLSENAVTNPQKGKKPKEIPNSYYTLGSIQQGTGVNLNACLGGDVPKAISLELLWKCGLHRVPKQQTEKL